MKNVTYSENEDEFYEFWKFTEVSFGKEREGMT